MIDVLGHLALEDLTLAFVGPATAVTGGILEDGVTAGLNLLPRTAVLADVQAVADLRGLLAALSDAGRRILALDGAVAATYTRPGETVAVTGHGSVLLVAFHQERGAETPDGPHQRAGRGDDPHLAGQFRFVAVAVASGRIKAGEILLSQVLALQQLLRTKSFEGKFSCFNPTET